MHPPRFNLLSLTRATGAVVLDDQTAVSGGRRSRLFGAPEEMLVAHRPDKVVEILQRAERLAEQGKTLAGFLSYEAGAAFGLATAPPASDLPLVWFGVYDRGTRLREDDWRCLPNPVPPAMHGGAFNVSPDDYIRGVERVRDFIAAGDTYQANLTCKYRFDLERGADPFDLYRHLRRAHPVAYGAYLNLGEAQILSFSPELFLSRRGDRLTARPMKGTLARGLGSARDEALRRRLRASEKDRAENVMIVDLMRNDLGRVCAVGSVRVPRLFECETLGTVHQMTSTVEGRVRPDAGFLEIVRAAFPSGSVTGAPKHRTMQIIRDLEREPRGPYCGAIGRLGPGKDFEFNVAIRTLVHRAGHCDLGVGSGITWSSQSEREWAETVLKTRFLASVPREFTLFETLRLDPDGTYTFLREHLARLARSARYWGWRFPRSRVVSTLEEVARKPDEDARATDRDRIVRIDLGRDGTVAVATRPLTDLHPPIRALLSSVRTDEGDPLVYHKTSRRDAYDAALAEAKKHACAEAILSNGADRLTEGSFTNLFVQIDGRWFTPPLGDGLLDGVWRRHFLRRRRATQRSLTRDDLVSAERVVLGNSVRAEMEVGSILDETGNPVWTARRISKSHPDTEAG
ncbi:aminodeoxychorismate synthase component I [Candidatus Sumerlaeota bacterium]|nr:aminodeoxychorismate synthase component I [Candidatus Sumerlaeota bacterium]